MSTMQPPTTLPRIDGITATIAAVGAGLSVYVSHETTGCVPTAQDATTQWAVDRLRSVCRVPNASERQPHAATLAERAIATMAMVSHEDAAELVQVLIGLAVIQEQVRVLLDMVDGGDDKVFVDTASTILSMWDNHYGADARSAFRSRWQDITPSLRQLAALGAAASTMQEIADLGDSAKLGTTAQRAAFGGVVWQKALRWLTVHGEAASAQPSPVAIAAE